VLLNIVYCVTMYLPVLISTLLAAVAVAMPTVDVVANVRGKKFDISAETVEEFSQQVESVAGLEAGQQSVLFRGKVLDPADKLEELGVANGDILNVLKGRKARAPKPAMDMDMDLDSDMMESGDMMEGGGGGGFPGMGGMGGGGGSPEDMMKNMSPEQMQQSMQAMEKLLGKLKLHLMHKLPVYIEILNLPSS